MGAIVVVLLTVASCSRAPSGDAPAERQVIVFAAASLRDAFTTMAAEFERSHPGVEVVLDFAGTQELRTQLEHGASVDVFASADQRHMDELVRASRVANPVVFARNELVIVVSSEGAGAIPGLAELPEATRIVIGRPEVPIGRYTLRMLDRAEATLGPGFRERLEAKVVSRELNARQVLTKVLLGEAQAGIVYRTDARSAEGRVRVVPIPPEINVIAEYPIAVVNGARQPELAREWVEFVRSPEGRRVLERAGFAGAAAGASR